MSKEGRPPAWQPEDHIRFQQAVARTRARWRPPLSASGAAEAALVSDFGRDAANPRCAFGARAGRKIPVLRLAREDRDRARQANSAPRDLAPGRSPGTILREVSRNASKRIGNLDYRVIGARWHADRATRRLHPGKLASNSL